MEPVLHSANGERAIPITSAKNPKVALWRSLKDRKARRETGTFLIEGRKMCMEAIASAWPVRAVILSQGFCDIPEIPQDIPLYILPETVFGTLCETKTPQGIAVQISPAPWEASGPRLLALDGVQDPGNVGTIIRTADAAGFDGVLFSPECADVFSPKVLRATMGSIFRMGLSFPASLPDTLKTLRESGYSVLSSQLDGEPFYERCQIADRFVLIIGNEGNGVSDAVSAQATHRLKLPMRGGAESLNAAVAAGIMMYDLTR